MTNFKLAYLCFLKLPSLIQFVKHNSERACYYLYPHSLYQTHLLEVTLTCITRGVTLKKKKVHQKINLWVSKAQHIKWAQEDQRKTHIQSLWMPVRENAHFLTGFFLISYHHRFKEKKTKNRQHWIVEGCYMRTGNGMRRAHSTEEEEGRRQAAAGTWVRGSSEGTTHRPPALLRLQNQQQPSSRDSAVFFHRLLNRKKASQAALGCPGIPPRALLSRAALWHQSDQHGHTDRRVHWWGGVDSLSVTPADWPRLHGFRSEPRTVGGRPGHLQTRL